MRKYLFILMAALLMVACGSKYHKEIRETFGEDTETIINIVLKSNDEERQMTESEQEKIDNYVKRYENQLDSSDENEAFISTVSLTFEQNDSLLPSEKEEIKESSEGIRMILKNGKDKYWEHVTKQADERNKEKDALRREGVDEVFTQDALEVTDTVDYYFNELNVEYDELPEEKYDSINEFDSNNYLGYDEELSNEEEDIYIEVIVLLGNYSIHGTESEEGLRDMTDSINESIEKIRDLTKGIN